MNGIFKRLSEIGIIPVIKINHYEDAVPLAKALNDGGVPAAEVTFRAANADKAIKAMSEAYPDMLVGAGTVLNIEHAQAAIDAGAKYIVSPGFNPKVVSYCQEAGVPVLPGCITPTEIEYAMGMGLSVLKFFPAAQFGGISTINALCAPYNGVKFIPTGGISLKNLEEYISNKNILACGGSFMVTEALINSKDWAQITDLCRQAITIIKTAREDK